ncbi:DUF554 domain-containing protein [Thiospirochaeta perfilievii]|uniref:DUF554 domain-containing protein n=1 Tax=Thiospirochaeta perfilievii TaxID=252967 RepID=A0A5C1QB44_9SPIO|nr:DUF554 domain-containing protein [Thiospirochaeta perfilievii]QEN03884.1 DUF554 domain-containing protein [Thiospirochaeta perfilievii]
MLGTYVNTLVIILGSILGLLIKNGLKEKYKTIVMNGVGLSVLFIGMSTTLNGILNGGEPILFIISIVIGGLIGEFIDIDLRLNRLGDSLQNRVGRGGEHNIAKGFVTASLIFCVGTMAILGSLESGLQGKHDMLYAKSVLDGVTSIILTSTLGIGVIFSSIAVLIYQGSITLLAKFIEPVLTVETIREISIIGGILIFSLGLNLLNIKKIKTANYLPAILIPPIYYLFI